MKSKEGARADIINPEEEVWEVLGRSFDCGSMIDGESAGEMEGGDSPAPKRMRINKSENQEMDLIIEYSHDDKEDQIDRRKEPKFDGGWESAEEMEGVDSPDLKRVRVDKSENQEMDLIIGHSPEDKEDEIDRRTGWESSEETEGGDSPDLMLDSPDLKRTTVEDLENEESDGSIEYDDGPNFLDSDDSDGLGSIPPSYHVEEFEKEILTNVDKVAADVYINQIWKYAQDPTILIFLLKEPPPDRDCRSWDYLKRTLPIYYKRMFPNNVFAFEVYYPYKWNRLPEIDLEYVRLYNGLRDCGKFQKTPLTEYNQSDYYRTAKAMASQLNIEKLSESDIKECLEDVFEEVDVESMLKFLKDYDFDLLDLFLQKKWPQYMDLYPRPDTSHCRYPFSAVIQQRKFLTWMNGLQDRNLEKAELEKLLTRHREEVERRCCATRIRYVKFKRALAKQLRLISDETD